MGTVTAPVSGSGSCPAWMARVAKPGCFLVAFISRGAASEAPKKYNTFLAKYLEANHLGSFDPRVSRQILRSKGVAPKFLGAKELQDSACRKSFRISGHHPNLLADRP